jgi:hypothetical protein
MGPEGTVDLLMCIVPWSWHILLVCLSCRLALICGALEVCVLLLVCYCCSRRKHVVKWLSLDRSLRWARTVQLTPTWQLLPIRWTQVLVSMNCDAGLLSLPAQADKVHARYGNSVILYIGGCGTGYKSWMRVLCEWRYHFCCKYPSLKHIFAAVGNTRKTWIMQIWRGQV